MLTAWATTRIQRGAQVADPAQEALAGAGEHEERRAERGDPQVGRRAVGDLALAAHQRRERRASATASDEQRDADASAEPQRLRAEPRRLARLARAVQPRHLRGRAVGEEVEDGEGGAQHARRDRQRRELRRAEVADDRRVDEHVQRLGGERAERRDGEPEDLAVVGRAAQHRRSRSPGVKLRLYHHHDGARVAYREAGTGPPLALLHSARAVAPRVGAAGRGALGSLPARAARPAAARRLRGPPAPPLLARLDRRGDGGLLPRGVRAAAAGRRARRRGAAAAARGADRAGSRRGGS